MKLAILDAVFAVCKLPDAHLPQWATSSPVMCFVRTPYETSLVCENRLVPETVTAERDWRCIRVEGTLDFSLVGVIAKISAILANANISIFVIST